MPAGHLAVGNDIIRAIEIQFVYLVLGHELIDVMTRLLSIATASSSSASSSMYSSLPAS